MEEYQQFLNHLHTRVTTPDDILAEVVFEATKQSITGKRRIRAGEVNEVYDLELGHQAHVILRISREARPEFERERWAIEQCRKAEVPVPVILLITHRQLGDQSLQFCIEAKLPGDSLELGHIDFPSFSVARKQAIMRQVGQLLSRMHSIPTNGFGELDGRGHGHYSSLAGLMREYVDQEKQFLDIAQAIDFDATAMKKILKILARKSDHAPSIQPHLSHNDLELKHILIQDDQVTGIVDFGGVSGHSAVNDFARWDYLYGRDIPIDWLQAGYENSTVFQDNFSGMLDWLRLNYGLNALWWYYHVHYPPRIRMAKEKLYQDLARYRDLGGE